VPTSGMDACDTQVSGNLLHLSHDGVLSLAEFASKDVSLRFLQRLDQDIG
jgi:hypothetical protein